MKKAKILYVEDYKLEQDLYSAALRRKGYEVDLASDGDEALRKMKTSHYDLVLLDLLLPRVSGLEVLQEYHRLPPDRRSSPRIVVLTDYDSPETVEQVTKMKINDYWLKVNNTPSILVRRVEALLA